MYAKTAKKNVKPNLLSSTVKSIRGIFHTIKSCVVNAIANMTGLRIQSKPGFETYQKAIATETELNQCYVGCVEQNSRLVEKPMFIAQTPVQINTKDKLEKKRFWLELNKKYYEK